MLKFQEKYSIAHKSFEDFVLVIFVLSAQCRQSSFKRLGDNHNCLDFRQLFPRMCERSQFNRRRRNLSAVIDQIFIEVAKQFEDEVFIADSFPLEVCKFGRAHFCKTFQDCGATVTARLKLLR